MNDPLDQSRCSPQSRARGQGHPGFFSKRHRRLQHSPSRIRHDRQVFAIDTGAHPRPARHFGVLATPTTLLARGGVVVNVIVGADDLRRAEALLRQG
jgi:hypothetical protein